MKIVTKSIRYSCLKHYALCLLDKLILKYKTVHNAHMLPHKYLNTITRVYAY